MKREYNLANTFLGEGDVEIATPFSAIPGTGTIRNDYGEKVFPQGFTTDTTMLTQKEIFDTIVYLTTVDPRLLKGCLNQMEDAVVTLSGLGQKNRIADLKIRIFMVSFALNKNDYLGQFTVQAPLPAGDVGPQ